MKAKDREITQTLTSRRLLLSLVFFCLLISLVGGRSGEGPPNARPPPWVSGTHFETPLSETPRHKSTQKQEVDFPARPILSLSLKASA